MRENAASGLLGRFLKIWAIQKVRFVAVGGCNTVFGFGCFSLAYFFLHKQIHYMLIMALTNVVAVTFAFVLHKVVVFQAKGDVIKEYLRFWGVYGVGIGISFGVFGLCVEVLGLNPYLAQGATIVLTTVVSFIGHKMVSFREAN